MKRFFIIGFLILLGFDTLSQVSFKIAAISTHPTCELAWLSRVIFNQWTYGALFGYLGAFITWMTVLEHAPIGPAFAITHLDVLTVAIASFIIFGERLSIIQVFGCILILIGIFILAFGHGKESTTV